MPGTRCYVKLCKNYAYGPRNDISFHVFPKDGLVKQQWIKFCKQGRNWVPKRHCRVCSVHFKKDDYELNYMGELLNVPVQRRLKKNSVPSVYVVDGMVAQDVERIELEFTDSNEKPAEVDNFVESLIISDEEDLNVEDELQKRHLAELERLYGEIGNLTKKAEQQEQTICKIKALNKSLAKDLHEERHENLYLKHQVNSLKKKMLEMSQQKCLASGITSYIGNGIHNSQNELILIVTDDDP